MNVVQCRSEYNYDQRPERFLWAGDWLRVSKLTAEWKTPEGHFFRVLTDARIAFELVFHETNDIWLIKLCG